MKKSERRAQFERSNRHGVDNSQRAKLSRRQLERAAREIQATRKSVKTVSEIVIENTEEDILLELIAELQGIQLVDKVEASPIIEKKSTERSEDDESSDSSCSSDDEGKDRIGGRLLVQEANPSGAEKKKTVMAKAAFTRKLIRDDRRERKALSTGEKQTSEKIAAKIRRTIQGKSTKDILHTPEKSGVMATPTSAGGTKTAPSTPISQSVRMSIACPKGKSKSDAPKVMVFPRNTTLEEIISKVRPKFNAGNKFNTLKIISTGKFLDDFELMTLPDGELLHLIAEDRKQESRVDTSVVPAPYSDSPVTENQDAEQKEIEKHHNEDAQIEDEEDWIAPRLQYSESLSGRKLTPDVTISENLRHLHENKANHPQYHSIRQAREQLPIYQNKSEILALIREHPVIVVSGETGSGKTTQLPHYLLEDMILKNRGAECNIICTQPRRIAATSVAERVHYEALESGSIGKGLIGYQIRLDSRSSEQTRLLYCTTGVLLRKIQDPQYLLTVSHIIIDEVHERGVETDFLMTILQQQLKLFPHLKLILMSATLQEQKFQEYFGSCPIVYVSGRMYPVTVKYPHEIYPLLQKRRANDNDRSVIQAPKFDPQLVSKLVSYIVSHYPMKVSSEMEALSSTRGSRGEAVLIFLSGIQQIEQLQKLLKQNKSLKSNNMQTLVLHGTMPPEQQRKVFRPTQPGEWKIILSTNIAETSITVDDVTHVIDCGFMKEQRFQAVTGITILQELFISRSNAAQRAGRAGRVKPGICWRLYDQAFFESSQVEEYPLPEMKRIPLEEIILQILYLQLGKPDLFLSECLDSPSMSQIRAAIANLIEIKAVYPKPLFPLTPLGFHLAKMPVDIRIGKMLIYGCLLESIDNVLTVASSLSCKSPFFAPIDKREEARRMHLQFLPNHREGCLEGLNAPSDHLAIVEAFNQWLAVFTEQGKGKASEFARRHYLSHTNLLEIKATREYYRLFLIEAGFLSAASVKSDFNLIDHIQDQLQFDFDQLEEEVGEFQEKREVEVDINEIHLTDEQLELQEMEDFLETIAASGQGKEGGGDVIFEDQKLLRENINDLLTRCALTAGLFPNIIRGIRVPDPKKEFKVKFLQADQTLSIHPSSLLSSRISSSFDEHRQDAFFIYHIKSVVNNQLQVFDLTKIPHLVLLLFTTHEITLANPGKKHSRKCQRIMINDWIEMEITELQLAIFRLLQKEMEKLLALYIEKSLPRSHEEEKKVSRNYSEEIQRYKQLLVKIILILMKNT